MNQNEKDKLQRPQESQYLNWDRQLGLGSGPIRQWQEITGVDTARFVQQTPKRLAAARHAIERSSNLQVKSGDRVEQALQVTARGLAAIAASRSTLRIPTSSEFSLVIVWDMRASVQPRPGAAMYVAAAELEEPCYDCNGLTGAGPKRQPHAHLRRESSGSDATLYQCAVCNAAWKLERLGWARWVGH